MSRHEENAPSAGPLSGLRVLDFGQYVAGPAVAMLLADQGAEVIRVNPHGGPRWRSSANDILDRGKRVIELNLKAPEAQKIISRLLETADVLIENFRPGVMKKLGLGPKRLRKSFPRLIYLSLPGFAREDQDHKDLRAWEGVVMAKLGGFSDLSANRKLRGLTPAYSPVPLASAYGAMFGAVAVGVALLKRDRDGCGATIETPLAAALGEAMSFSSMNIHDLPERYVEQQQHELNRRLAGNLPFDMTEGAVDKLQDALYRIYFAADGRPFYLVSVAHRNHPVRALKLLGIWEQVKEAGFPLNDPYVNSTEWPGEHACSLYAHPLSPYWSNWLSEKIAKAVAGRTALEWEQVFGENSVSGCAVRTFREWMTDPHALSSGLTQKTPDGLGARPGPFSWMEGQSEIVSGLYDRKFAPEDRLSGQETDWLGAGDMPGDPIPEPNDKTGLPLAGLRIVDITNVIAGPTVGSTLARFGADVININKPQPAHDPSWGLICGLKANQGKRSILVDVKKVEGAAVLERLLKEAHLLVVNSPENQLEKLGLDPERLNETYPGLVVCRIDAFGGPLPGPMSNYIGYDDLTQALTGIMERFGGGLAKAESHAQVGSIDVGCGLLAAFQSLLALRRRNSVTGPKVARASLAATGLFIQLPFANVTKMDREPDEPRGPYVRGEGPYYHCYRAQDGWAFFAAPDCDPEVICKVFGVSEVASLTDQECIDKIHGAFEQAPISFWQAAFANTSVCIVSIDSLSTIRERYLDERWCKDAPFDRYSSLRFCRDMSHPSGHVIDMVIPGAIRSDDLKIITPKASEKLGHSTTEVLLEIGFTLDDVHSMEKHDVVSSSCSECYIPK